MEQLKEQNPGILISRTKEYYEEFCKSFDTLKSKRKDVPRRHHPIDDFQDANHAYSHVESLLNKTSTLTKSHKDIINVLHSTTAIKIISKLKEEEKKNEVSN